VRWVVAIGLIAGCGRVGFDPLGGGGGDDSVGDAAGSGDPTPSRHYITGGTATQTIPTPFISTMTGALTDSDMVLVVAIHWRDTASSVTTVQDTFGNGFSMAGSVSQFNGAQSQIVWFKRVNAGTAINVFFDQPAPSIDLKWAAYRDIDQMSPTAGTIDDVGIGTTADSGTLSVTGPTVLVAASASRTADAAAGPGYTQRQKANGGVLEDRETGDGVFNATAALSNSDEWIIHLVALRPR